MAKFKEYQVVLNIRDLDQVPKGSQGTVLIVYESGTDYEVEFLDRNGDSLNTLTISEVDLVASE